MNLELCIEDRDQLFSRACLESANFSRTITARKPRACPIVPPPRRQTPLHELKLRMLRDALADASDSVVLKKICGAANRAADQAWETAFPLLVFPCLFEQFVDSIRASGSPLNTREWSAAA